MRSSFWAAAAVGLAGTAAWILYPPASAEPTAEAKQPVRKPFGLEKRELWTTSLLVGVPLVYPVIENQE